MTSQCTETLLDRLSSGDPDAVGDAFEHYRERLGRMLRLRLDPRVKARLSPDDVLQEAFLDVARRIGEYLADPAVPFYVWLRYLTLQRMHALQRVHIGVASRAVEREADVSICSTASAASIRRQLVSDLTSPSQAAISREMHERLRSALDAMESLDREVLTMRHFEDLGNREVAAVLGITKDAASKRHIRALKRLRSLLANRAAG